MLSAPRNSRRARDDFWNPWEVDLATILGADIGVCRPPMDDLPQVPAGAATQDTQPHMTTSVTPSHIALAGHFERTIDSDKIGRYASAPSEKELTSLWGRIKDFFMGTHKEDAKLAIFRLANAQDTETQFRAFADLTRYVSPEHGSVLKWNIASAHGLDFQIGGDRIMMQTDAEAFLQQSPALSIEDSCRVLMTLTHDDHRVIEGMSHAGLHLDLLGPDATPAQLHKAARGHMFGMPALLDAMHVLGMHRDSEQMRINPFVTDFVRETLLAGGASHSDAHRFSEYASTLVLLTSAVRQRD